MPEVFTVTWASLGEGAHEGSAKREVSVRPNGRDTRGHITGNQPELQHWSVSSCRGLTYQNRTQQHSLCPTMKRTKNLRALNSTSPFPLVSISVSHWPEQERNQGKRSSRWVQRGVYVCPLNAECKPARWEGKRQGTSQELLRLRQQLAEEANRGSALSHCQGYRTLEDGCYSVLRCPGGLSPSTAPKTEATLEGGFSVPLWGHTSTAIIVLR